MKKKTLIVLLILCFVAVSCSPNGIGSLYDGTLIPLRYVDQELGVACYHLPGETEIACVKIDPKDLLK